ncbi:hypothetical protein K439DRAFT_1383413 [Ramaria rubella]|nr:hypothetical protein K439DRAFT_1383413 [Ramaria rubella]
MLSDSESETSDLQLTVNEHFAKAYVAKKEREELGKLKDKYGSDAEEDDTEEDEEDAETEDEDGEELTPAVDAAILRTLARIKRKDPDIYDKDKSVFEQEQERTERKTLRSKPIRDITKPLTIKQHALSSMLQATSRSPSPERLAVTHDQELNALRSETIAAFHGAIDVSNDDDGGLLILREKTKDEAQREEEDYQEFLRREVGEDIKSLVTIEGGQETIKVSESAGEIEETITNGKKKGVKKKGKEKEGQETDQEFLMNYILNRGWIDRSVKRVPTYNEVTHHSEPSNEQIFQRGDEETLVSEDDEFEEIVDRFESSYNFRFEEPDAAVIATHPRNLSSIVRREDTKRKEARERRKQRKEEELQKKREEVRRMKALKMKELRQKLEQIGKEGGVDMDSEALAEFDLDGDWDPEKHDKQMAGLYDNHGHGDMEKPRWDDDIDVTDIFPTILNGPPKSKSQKKKKQKKADATADGVDVDAMDADIPREPEDEEEWDGSEEMRKRKVQEYMDEVYGMDFNDMVGDLPTRFKYTTVAPHSFALTPAEMLLATDAELNEYMGIKKLAPYRKDGRWDLKRADRLKELKAKLKERSWGPGTASTDPEETRTAKKRKGKKERQRAKVSEVHESPEPIPDQHLAKKRKE